MTERPNGQRDESGRYEIRLRGHLEPRWGAWFDGMTLATEDDGTTIVTGSVVDQSALQGLLRKVHDMGIQLISVTELDPNETNATGDPR